MKPKTSSPSTLLLLIVFVLPAIACGALSQSSVTEAPVAAPAARQVTLSELTNQVDVRANETAAFVAATGGQMIEISGQVQTGVGSRVRLDFTEGTIVRLDENTLFTLTVLEQTPDNLFTRLQLATGRVWVQLGAGSMEVETPAGVAAVRGSLLGVSYTPGLQQMLTTCLEGDCTVETDNELFALLPGFQVVVKTGSAVPLIAGLIDQTELTAWQANNPEITGSSGAPIPLVSNDLGDGWHEYIHAQSGFIAQFPSTWLANEASPAEVDTMLASIRSAGAGEETISVIQNLRASQATDITFLAYNSASQHTLTPNATVTSINSFGLVPIEELLTLIIQELPSVSASATVLESRMSTLANGQQAGFLTFTFSASDASGATGTVYTHQIYIPSAIGFNALTLIVPAAFEAGSAQTIDRILANFVPYAP